MQMCVTADISPSSKDFFCSAANHLEV